MEIVKGLAGQQLSKGCGVLGIGLCSMCSLLEDKKDALSLGWYVGTTASSCIFRTILLSEALCNYKKENHYSLLDFSVVLQLYLPMPLCLAVGSI